MGQYPLVREFMDRSFVRLRPEMDVYDAIEVLLNKRLTGAAVVDEEDNVVGILSERDCLRTMLQGAYNSLPSGQVADYMTREVRSIDPNTDIFAVADFFSRNVYRRLLIVESGFQQPAPLAIGENLGGVAAQEMLGIVYHHDSCSPISFRSSFFSASRQRELLA